MTNFVLDSSAILRMLDKEAGWQRVAEILELYAVGSCALFISAVQWGEIAGRIRKRGGVLEQIRVMGKLSQLQLVIEPVMPEQAVRAAELKADRGISYADAFALELATRSPERILITADYDFKNVSDLANIEFLPSK